MAIEITRLDMGDGVIFENIEVAPDHFSPFWPTPDQCVIEFMAARKIVTSGTRPALFPGDPNVEWSEESWRAIPGAHFKITLDPEQPLHAQMYAAVLADPRFAGDA
jgi:hypothetical protein